MRNSLLLKTFIDPQLMARLSLRDWNQLIPIARAFGILGRFHPRLQDAGLIDAIPSQVLPHLQAGYYIAAEHERIIRWEVNRIQRALVKTTIPITLLKGAAYTMSDLPCARGRLASDVDILVPKSELPILETELYKQGWAFIKQDPYDEQYYRRWMHELPPMRHRIRGTTLDVHHTILPLTSRLNPDPNALLAQAQLLSNYGLQVLAPTDMVLHSATHAFYDGELNNSLRDLLDLHDLCAHFGADPAFWDELPNRANRLNLARPLWYALHYCQRYFATPMPADIFLRLQQESPPRLTRVLMDQLLDYSIAQPSITNHKAAFARWLLYVRSHWLRMPPLLLTKHLSHKTVKRLQSKINKTNQTII